jgi:PAS domain S-box-containing protein
MKTAPMRILLLEDNPDDAEMLVFELRRAGFEAACRRVDGREEFRAALEPPDGPPDVILADYSLPQFNALEALEMLHAAAHDIPVIVVSGAPSEEACVDALRHGAVDYLLKDRLSRLGPAVQHALSQRRLAADQRRAELTFRAAFDHAPVGMAVTDLAGRVLQVNQELSRMTGLRPADFLPDTVCEDDRPVFEDRLKRLVAGEADKVTKELRLCRPDGSTVWGQYSASLIASCTRSPTSPTAAAPRRPSSGRPRSWPGPTATCRSSTGSRASSWRPCRTSCARR